MLPNISVLWFVDCDDPATELGAGVAVDPAGTADFIARAFTTAEVTPIGTTDLAAIVGAADNRVFAAHYGRLAVLAGTSLHTAEPGELTAYLTDLGIGRTWALVSIDPTADVGCFARWESGESYRAFAGTSTSIRMDEGVPYPFEGPFWAGEHPQADTDDPLALPFHPGALADAAHRAWFGFGFGPDDPAPDDSAPDDSVRDDAAPRVDPTTVPVAVYRVGPDDGHDQHIASSTRAHTGDEAPSDLDQTEPIEKVTVEPGTERLDDTDSGRSRERVPGPLSRYFGFRGRL